MENEKPRHTLGDYSKPGHEGYQNTIEVPDGNNVVSLRTDTHPTSKLRNDILMFQKHQGESLSEAWTRFKDSLQKVPHHGLDLWLQIQIFYDHVNPITRCPIDQAIGGKLRDKNDEESWALLEDLDLYDNESWNDPRDFAKPVNPQPRELEPSFEARMQEYMASRAERIKRFEKAIFNQTDEINGRMAEMFGLLKELTSSTTPKKVLVREEIRNSITKNVNAIALCRIESEKAKENNEVIDKNITEHGKCSIEEPIRITNKEPLGEERKNDRAS
ncbi:hypothetical protein Tco_0575950 [Tanacetum coccineum]